MLQKFLVYQLYWQIEVFLDFLKDFEKNGIEVFKKIFILYKVDYFNLLFLPNEEDYLRVVSLMPTPLLVYQNLVNVIREKVFSRIREKYEMEMIQDLRFEIYENTLENLHSNACLSSGKLNPENTYTPYLDLSGKSEVKLFKHSFYYSLHKIYPELIELNCENMDLAYTWKQTSRLLSFIKVGRILEYGFKEEHVFKETLLSLEESQRFIDFILTPIKELKSLERLNWAKNHIFGHKCFTNDLRSIDTLADHPSLKILNLKCATPGPLKKLLLESPVADRTLILGGAVRPTGKSEFDLKWPPIQYLVGGPELTEAVSRWGLSNSTEIPSFVYPLGENIEKSDKRIHITFETNQN